MEKKVSIIGAGIAGCSLAHFLARAGWLVTIFESESEIAMGGSGNPAAAIYPKFMLNDDAYNKFMLKSFMFTTTWISQIGLSKNNYRFNGAVEILEKEYSHKLGLNLSQSILDSEKFFNVINETILKKNYINKHLNGILYHQGGWVNPVALCRRLVEHPNIKILPNHKILSIEKLNDQWAVKTINQKTFNSLKLAICNAEYAPQFDLTQHLHMDVFRGQINWMNQVPFKMPSIVSCSEGYLVPLINKKYIFGATYAMNDFTKSLRLSDTKKNISSIKDIHQEFYNHCKSHESIPGRVAWRASSKDRKPYVGRLLDNYLLKKMRIRELAHADQLPWIENLYVSIAFGSRGFTFAPYCAFVLANQINGDLSIEDKETLNYTNPERYRLKKMSLKKVASRIYQV